MSIAPNATEERPQALGRVFRHEFARALAYLRLGAIPAYIVAYFGIRRVFRVTARGQEEHDVRPVPVSWTVGGHDVALCRPGRIRGLVLAAYRRYF